MPPLLTLRLSCGGTRLEVVGDRQVGKRDVVRSCGWHGARRPGGRRSARREPCEPVVEIGVLVGSHGAQSSPQFHTPLSSSCGLRQFGGIGGMGLPGGQSLGTPGGRVVVVTGIVEVVVGDRVTGGSVGSGVIGPVVGSLVDVDAGQGDPAVRTVVEVFVLDPAWERWRFGVDRDAATAGAAMVAGWVGAGAATNPAGAAAVTDRGVPSTTTLSYTSSLRVITPADTAAPGSYDVSELSRAA